MRNPALLMVFFISFGCSKSVSKEDLEHLNGYWEIAEVEFTNGQKKVYTKASPTIDYLEWDGSAGFRKKVYPKLKGTFDTSDDAEPFKIIENGDNLMIHYKNAMSDWKETLVHLNADHFSVMNEEGTIYHYRRHEPLKLLK